MIETCRRFQPPRENDSPPRTTSDGPARSSLAPRSATVCAVAPDKRSPSRRARSHLAIRNLQCDCRLPARLANRARSLANTPGRSQLGMSTSNDEPQVSQNVLRASRSIYFTTLLLSKPHKKRRATAGVRHPLPVRGAHRLHNFPSHGAGELLAQPMSICVLTAPSRQSRSLRSVADMKCPASPPLQKRRPRRRTFPSFRWRKIPHAHQLRSARSVSRPAQRAHPGESGGAVRRDPLDDAFSSAAASSMEMNWCAAAAFLLRTEMRLVRQRDGACERAQRNWRKRSARGEAAGGAFRPRTMRWKKFVSGILCIMPVKSPLAQISVNRRPIRLADSASASRARSNVAGSEHNAPCRLGKMRAVGCHNRAETHSRTVRNKRELRQALPFPIVSRVQCVAIVGAVWFYLRFASGVPPVIERGLGHCIAFAGHESRVGPKIPSRKP